MIVKNFQYSFQTPEENSIVDISQAMRQYVKESDVDTGTLTVFVPGSTGAITTIEYEQGLKRDFPQFWEQIIPKNAPYQHNVRNMDDNGHGHIRASVVGPSLVVPIVKGRLTLGTWQQVVFCEFDTRPRHRHIEVIVMGL